MRHCWKRTALSLFTIIVIEMYKASKGISPAIITELFEKRNEIWDIILWIQCIMELKAFYFWVLKFGTSYQIGLKRSLVWKVESLRNTRVVFARYSQCQFYLRKPDFFQIGKRLTCVIFISHFSVKNDIIFWIIIVICIVVKCRFHFTFSLISFHYRKLAPISTSN